LPAIAGVHDAGWRCPEIEHFVMAITPKLQSAFSPAALIMGAHRLISLARVAWAASGVALCSPSNYCHCRSDWFEDSKADQNQALQMKPFPVD
jgi:hypothetical protein